MTCKVLFIDDDQSLLRSIERNLCFDFDVSTASCMTEALHRIETLGAYAVVVVDMLMPEADGIETIQQLRQRMPDTVFVMLTGNQDVNTARQALNQGQVYRFLTKPCEMSEIREAIVEANKYYVESVREKDLLLETMMGSLSMLTEFAALSSDHLIAPDQMKDRFLDIAEAMQIKVSSHDIAACRVLAVGLASMNVFERQRLKETAIYEPEHKILLSKLCHASAKMVSRIPQFAVISELLSYVPTADTILPGASARHAAASLIRITFYWSLMDHNGADREWISQCLKRVMPNIPEKHWTCILHELACTTQKVPRAAFANNSH